MWRDAGPQPGTVRRDAARRRESGLVPGRGRRPVQPDRRALRLRRARVQRQRPGPTPRRRSSSGTSSTPTCTTRVTRRRTSSSTRSRRTAATARPPEGPVLHDQRATAPSRRAPRTATYAQRRPGDGAWVTTRPLRFRYDGRWLMTQLRICPANGSVRPRTAQPSGYGPNIIDQWKARAFQQRPSGTTPCCGYEEEVNNWGGSSILFGERWARCA